MTTGPVMSITDDQIAELEALAGRINCQVEYVEYNNEFVEWWEPMEGVKCDTEDVAEYIYVLASRNAALITRLREAERDAARYRFIREVASGAPEDFEVVADAAFVAAYGCDHNFDLNIDAAMMSVREAAE